MGNSNLDSLPPRDRVLILLRSHEWRSEQKLCQKVCRRNISDDVSRALSTLMGDGLVEYHDSSLHRYRLTAAGRSEAKRVWDSYVKGKAA